MVMQICMYGNQSHCGIYRISRSDLESTTFIHGGCGTRDLLTWTKNDNLWIKFRIYNVAVKRLCA